MAQPPAYIPVHSFVSDSATLANFPGQALDVEFNDVKATTDAIRANLALIQRDDGLLVNGSVGYDQLAPSLQATGLSPVLRKKRVILVSGQSNPEASLTYAWTPNPNAFIWNGGREGVTGTAFGALDSTKIILGAKIVSDLADAANLSGSEYLINVVQSGTAISHWLSGTGAPDVYATLKREVEAALAVLGLTKLDQFVWWQGETDIGSSTYAANLTTLIARLQGETWFPRETPILFYALSSDAQAGTTGNDATNRAIQSVASADPDFRTFFYTPSFVGATYWTPADLHMTAQGYFSAGAASAKIISGHGRPSQPNTIFDPVSGKFAWGNPVRSSVADFTYNSNASNIVATLPSIGTTHHISADAISGSLHYSDCYGGHVQWVGRRFNGTFAAPTKVLADQILSGLGAFGYDASGNSYLAGSLLLYSAEDANDATHHGSYANLYLKITGTDSLVNYKFEPGGITIPATTSGGIKIAIPAVSGSNVITLPAATGTVALTATTIATVKQQKFTSTGNYTPSTGLLYAIIETVGPGGGGGASAGTASTSYSGGGGGAGAYSRAIKTLAQIQADASFASGHVTVTIGTGGAGGAAGSNNGANGSGATSVGALCIANAGTGGLFGSIAQIGKGSLGGTAGTGDLTSAGNPGRNGIYFSSPNTTACGGDGGGAVFGGAGLGGQSAASGGNQAGNNATGFGSGGGGGSSNGAGNTAGGNALDGVAFITEFCSQ